MWDSWSLPQGPPRWVLLKGSPFLGWEKVARGPSLLANLLLSLSIGSAASQLPPAAPSWMELSLGFSLFLGGHNQCLQHPFESIKTPRARSDSCDCSGPSRTGAPHLSASGRCSSSTKSEPCLRNLWYYLLRVLFALTDCVWAEMFAAGIKVKSQSVIKI